MVGPAHFGGGIRSESFGVDGFVGGLPFRAQSFISFGLAVGAASSHIRSPQVARCV